MVRWNDRFIALCQAAEAARAALPPIYQAPERAFAAANPLLIFGELRKYANQQLKFVEWGSGVGTITIMADLLGYRAFGIERDVRLVSVAQRLAEQVGSDAVFGAGNFVPPAHLPTAAPSVPAEFALDGGGADGYAAISCLPTDIDLFYVFPHPEMIDVFHELFTRVAKPGARLLIYSQLMEVLTSVRTLMGATALVLA